MKTIGEIVQCLNECENEGIDFIAFTDILYNHLGAGCDTTQTLQITGPIYAEPGLAHLDIVNSTNGGRNNQNFMGDNDIGGDGEHIYAEPINLQQPLLRNDYNVPIDNDSANHMYTEPLTGAIGEDLFCHKCCVLINGGSHKPMLDTLRLEKCTCKARIEDLYSHFIYS